jgi:hypothetical protein
VGVAAALEQREQPRTLFDAALRGSGLSASRSKDTLRKAGL